MIAFEEHHQLSTVMCQEEKTIMVSYVNGPIFNVVRTYLSSIKKGECCAIVDLKITKSNFDFKDFIFYYFYVTVELSLVHNLKYFVNQIQSE